MRLTAREKDEIRKLQAEIDWPRHSIECECDGCGDLFAWIGVCLAEMGSNMSYSFADKLKCVKRELALRRTAYPRWVTAGKILPDAASYEIAVMQSIVDDYQRAVDRNGNRSQADAQQTPVDQHKVPA